MIHKLESYASNLEELVEHRTSELFEEKKKTEILLYRMLPRCEVAILNKNEYIQSIISFNQ